ncbi:MAG: pilus assembly protein [Chloroflexi bacterium]|nr:pilus assembly protein [Chloroflexota bacterium]
MKRFALFSHPFSRKPRARAQTMVEFALVMPILLLIMVGLLEVGRLIFMYSTVISASREAVRYGSAMGLNVTGGVPRYEDCTGIRAAAQNMDFLGMIDDINIVIAYDHGPGSAVFLGCPPATVINGDRILVTVTATFLPTSGLVPLHTIMLSASSARTMLINISVIK